MKRWARGRQLVCLALLLCLCAPAASAHVYATRTLRGLVFEADVVLVARIASSDAGTVRSTEPAGRSRPAVEAEVLEVLDGPLEGQRVRFAQHGHGVADFRPGEETLVFLTRIARNRELDTLGRTGEFDWVSLQEHGDEYPLEAGTREPLLFAVRQYLEAGQQASAEEQLASIRRATLALLESGDAHLASSALRDLNASPGLKLVTEADARRLTSMLSASGVSMGVRVGLLTELERRGLVDAVPYWLALLSDPMPAADRVTAIRAAGDSTAAPVRARLVALVEDPNDRVAAAAAVALGAPGRDASVAPLAKLLGSNRSETVRFAAIRGLGRIGSAGSRIALEQVAASHPDAKTRRRASAELRREARPSS